MINTQFAELVFGFVYAVGTDADPVVSVLENYLTQYLYKTETFRISEHLRSLNLKMSFESSSAFEKMKVLMDAGNEARRQAESDNILAAMAVNEFASHREEDETNRPIQRERVANVVRSLKRPEEVLLLRDVYRPGFFLIAIADDEDAQFDYLMKEKGLTEDEARLLIERDQEEHKLHGQRTRGTFYLADVFVERRHERYKDQLHRFLELVFGHPFYTPSREEHGMFMAYTSAARSAQLGRQVGAAIATPEGDVVAVGMNEVPSCRGGPYWENDDDDARDHMSDIDSNVKYKDNIISSIVAKLDGKLLTEKKLSEVLAKAAGALKPTLKEVQISQGVAEEEGVASLAVTETEVKEAIGSSDLKDITEYGRAVHGEMDAILCCARLGISVRGKHLFVTTFPCHNCTRHIIACGIRKVYYIEPYAKSKARDLHSDAICFSEEEAKETGRIPFLPFVGVGLRRYLDLFSLELSSGRPLERKDDAGKPNVPSKIERPPRVPMSPFSYLEREDKLLEEFGGMISRLQGKNHGKN